jgi:hypothetical protein
VTHARDIWWTLDFANAFVSPGVNSRGELVPSHGASRRRLGDYSLTYLTVGALNCSAEWIGALGATQPSTNSSVLYSVFLFTYHPVITQITVTHFLSNNFCLIDDNCLYFIEYLAPHWNPSLSMNRVHSLCKCKCKCNVHLYR